VTSIKFEYRHCGPGQEVAPLNKARQEAYERSVNILYEDYADNINEAEGSIITLFNNEGGICAEFALSDFPQGVPDYKQGISEIIRYIS
jgi:hypothetical protein